MGKKNLKNPDPFSFGWFGTRVEVVCDHPGLDRWIRSRWGDLPYGGATRERREYRISLLEGGPPVFAGPSGVRPLDPDRAELHAYSLFSADLWGVVDSHFLFHASSVAHDGRGLIVSGPSTFGKTTLAIMLTQHGFGLLADDVTAVDRTGGEIAPSARPLGLRPRTRDRLDAGSRRAAEVAALDTAEDDWSVDPTRWLGPPPAPARPAMVVLLRPHADGVGLRRFPFHELILREPARAVRDELLELPGVLQVETRADDPRYARVRTENGAALVDWLDRHAERVVATFKRAVEPPEFDRPPHLERVGTFQASVELSQEMINRRPESRLGAAYRGRETRLVADVAGLLGDARCYCLLPGRQEETIRRVAEEFRRV